MNSQIDISVTAEVDAIIHVGLRPYDAETLAEICMCFADGHKEGEATRLAVLLGAELCKKIDAVNHANKLVTETVNR